MSVRRSAIDLPARECRALCAAMSGGPGWICTINLPIQSRALCWLSYRARSGAGYRCCPGLISFTGRVHGCSAKPAESGGSLRSCSPFCVCRTIRFRGGPGALVRFNFRFEIGESPRCCPVLRGLRDRCIAAMLATQKRKSVVMLHKLRLQLRPASNRRRHARPL